MSARFGVAVRNDKLYRRVRIVDYLGVMPSVGIGEDLDVVARARPGQAPHTLRVLQDDTSWLVHTPL